jgi:hypothetical protein
MSRKRGRPPTENQQTIAYAIYRADPTISYGKLLGVLEVMYGDLAVNESTIRRWVAQWKKQDENGSYLDERFSWSRLIQSEAADRGGLPPDAGQFLLGIWTDMIKVDEVGQPVWGLRPPGGESIFTNRNAIWSWRVHQIAPEVSQEDNYLLALLYSSRQQLQESEEEAPPKDQISYADLDAFLGFKPWLDGEKHKQYLLALKDHVIKPLDLTELGLVALAATSPPEPSPEREKSLAMYGFYASLLPGGGSPTYDYPDEAICWVEPIESDDYAEGHRLPGDLMCPYGTPMQLLAWSKLYGFFGRSPDDDDPTWRSKAEAFWRYHPPFQFDYYQLSRIFPLIILDPELEEGCENHEFFSTLQKCVPGREGERFCKMMNDQSALILQRRP